MSATAEITAAQNRLKMSVAFRFVNTKLEEDDFSKTYSFFYDFPAELQVYDVKMLHIKRFLIELLKTYLMIL